MTTFDLHFHANIHRMPALNKRRRLKKIRQHLEKSGLDYLASTEHSYKKPLEAYQRLADATADIKTTIIPGVEAVSSEGIDIIFLYRDEAHLKHALEQYSTLNWTIRDVARISEDTDAISIIPHPFHIGRSSAGNILSSRAYRQLLKKADYVEIHNGSALTIDERLSHSAARHQLPGTQAKIDLTIDLPPERRGTGLGWAVSSDAHYPGDQYIVGETDIPIPDGMDVFDYLQKRIRFAPHLLAQPSTDNIVNNFRLLRSFQGVLKEGLIKEFLKTRGRAQALMAACVYYGFYIPK
ncbi:hypothetical protein [uncultured Pseudodesulfovibrio sp.]|uniref:PHP domain-containing protein n=1 Tax=uncultured Pseudodesulfovibrio sp. TaxID=2035858 RepID=UPI0029C7732F|nr:hypothetical protein [uncultured Pseudodesulfovibrio sp.]